MGGPISWWRRRGRPSLHVAVPLRSDASIITGNQVHGVTIGKGDAVVVCRVERPVGAVRVLVALVLAGVGIWGVVGVDGLVRAHARGLADLLVAHGLAGEAALAGLGVGAVGVGAAEAVVVEDGPKLTPFKIKGMKTLPFFFAYFSITISLVAESQALIGILSSCYPNRFRIGAFPRLKAVHHILLGTNKTKLFLCLSFLIKF